MSLKKFTQKEVKPCFKFDSFTKSKYVWTGHKTLKDAQFRVCQVKVLRINFHQIITNSSQHWTTCHTWQSNLFQGMHLCHGLDAAFVRVPT